MKMDTTELEEHLFNRYKCFAKKYVDFNKGCVSNYWELIQELQVILNTFFEYDFTHSDNHYLAIKNEKVVYDYIVD